MDYVNCDDGIYIYIHTYINYITLHYITLHCIALHYITLHTYIHIYIYTYIHIHIYIYIYVYIYIYIYTLIAVLSPPSLHFWFDATNHHQPAGPATWENLEQLVSINGGRLVFPRPGCTARIAGSWWRRTTKLNKTRINMDKLIFPWLKVNIAYMIFRVSTTIIYYPLLSVTTFKLLQTLN